MTPRAVIRAVAALTVSAGLVLAAALPASADEGLGEKSGWGIPNWEIFMIFIGLPLIAYVIITLLVSATSRGSSRADQAWWSQPEYFSTSGAVAPGDGVSGDLESSKAGDGGAGARW